MSGIISDNVLKQSGLIKAPSGGAWTLISTVAASSSGTLSFTGIDSTYKTHLVVCNNMHPSNSDAQFQFNVSDDASSHSYDISKTTILFKSYHSEGDASGGPGYDNSYDHGNGTGFQGLNGDGIGIDADQCTSGFMYFFDLANSTFVKHFTSKFNGMTSDDYLQATYVGGYFNTTSPITAIQFKYSAGNIDDGDIYLYGLKI